MKLRFYLLIATLYLMTQTSCTGTNNLQDGGSTVGPGFYPAGDSYVKDSEEGIAIVCESESKITSLTSLVTKELSKQKLTISQPTGNLSESTASVLDRLTRLDSSRAALLKTEMTSRLDNINFAVSSLSNVTALPGASLETGCRLERVYEEQNGKIVFSQELWDQTSTTEKTALLTELVVMKSWTPGVTAEKSRSLAGLLMSREISDMSINDYEKYIKDLQAH